MADRTTKVTLTAQVSNYIAGMEKAAAATRATGSAAEKLAAQKESFNQVGHALLAIGAVAAVGVGLAVAKFSEFDAKMSQVKTLSHATANEMDQLTAAALSMGQAIGFSASEVADAEIELVKAGVSVKDIMGGALKGALELAAAGQISVADATEIATIALTQFKLTGSDVPHVADLLAAGADKALGGVSDLGEALKSGGLVASQFGVSLEETVGTLSAFANAGLLGETAGTDLRQMLLKLSNPSKQAADDMTKYGISIYDASGKFVGLSNLAGQLRDKLGGLDEATRNQTLSTIFGARAIAGANVLYNEGADGVRKWTNNVNDSGFAAQQARGKMDNLQGDIKKLGAAFETDLIKNGSTANGVLRDVVKVVGGLAAAFGDLSGPAQGTILAVGVVVAGLSLLGGTVLILVPKIAAFRAALAGMGTGLRTVSLAGGAVGLAITALVTAFAILGQNTATSKANIQALTDTLDQNTGAMTKNTRASVVKRLADEGVYDAAKKAGISIREVNAAVFNGGKALDDYNKKSADYYSKAGLGTNIMRSFNGQADALASGVNNIRHDMEASKSGWKTMQEGAASAGDGLSKSQKSAAAASKAYKDTSSKVEDLTSQISALIDTVNKSNNVGQDAVSANAAYRKSIQDVDDYIKKAKDGTDGYTLTLEETTAAGAANVDMLSNLAKTNEDAAAKQFALDGDTAHYKQTLEDGRQAVIDRAMQLGATRDQAVDLANKIAAIPTEKQFQMLVDTNNAQLQIAGFVAMLNSIPGSKMVSVGVDVFGAGPLAPFKVQENGGIHAYADGGIAPGIFSGGAPMYKFAEPNTRWEAFISGKSGQEARNRQVWQDAGRRLGMDAGSAGGTMQVSLAGATILMSVDGRQMTAVIQDQIVQNDRRGGSVISTGKQKGF